MNSFDVVIDFVRSTQTLNKDLFVDLIDDNCEIDYKFNGTYNVTTKQDYVSRLINGHFNNTTKVDVIELGIKKDRPHLKRSAVDDYTYEGIEFFTVEEIADFTRLGLGKDENVPGIYHMESTGILRVKDNKIIYMSYEFNKHKLE